MISIMSDDLVSGLSALSHTRRSFPTGAFLFHRDDDVELVHVICRGTVKLVRYQTDGQMAVLQRVSAGDILAEASVFSQRYHCHAVATSHTETEAYPVAAIQHLLDTDIQFCRGWAVQMSHNLQEARRRAEITSLRTVAERLDAWLTWNESSLPAKGEWKSIAEEVGVSPEAFYREIAARRQRRLVSAPSSSTVALCSPEQHLGSRQGGGTERHARSDPRRRHGGQPRPVTGTDGEGAAGA